MNTKNIARLAVLALGLLAGSGGLGCERLMAQDVTVALILGRDHNLGDRGVGDSVDPTKNVRAGAGTIVVLRGVWSGSCYDVMIVTGKTQQFGTNLPNPCSSERTGTELLAAARSAETLAEHALALGVSDAKADGPGLPRWVSDLEREMSRLDEQQTSKPQPAPAQVSLAGTYTIQQASNARYVDAHEGSNKDFGLVTRAKQNNNTQRWLLTSLGNNTYTIQQASNARYVDAHEGADRDFSLVTRLKQSNRTQIWILTTVGNDLYTIQQASNRRYVDAHEGANNDFRLVTRPKQNNNTQRWIIKRG